MADGDATTLTRREAAKKVFALATGQIHSIALRPLSAQVLDVEDAHFHHDSAVMLPDFGDCDAPPSDASDQNHVSGLAVLRSVYLHAEANPKQKLLIAGHADRSGADAYNLTISQQRADNVLHLLLGERAEWVAVSDKKHKVEDYQQILKFVNAQWAWGCDPGAVNNVKSAQTTEAVRTFQKNYNAGTPRLPSGFTANLAVDGDVGPQTWGAFFDVYLRMLEELMQTDAAGLAARRKTLAFVDAQRTVGCGENHPLTANEIANRQSQIDRRVEVLFFDPGEEPKLDCHPAKGKCTADACEIYRKKLFKLAPIPCTPVKPVPPVGAVNPVIEFPTAEKEAAAPAGDAEASVKEKETAITSARRLVVVKRHYTTAARADVDLKTDKPFDGVGTFTRSSDRIKFFLGAKELTFDGKDNVFGGGELEVGVTLFADADKASDAFDDVTLTLTLSEGTKPPGAPATAKMTALELTLDVCDPRTAAADPPALPQAPAAKPAPGDKVTDKFFRGRPVPVQDDAKLCERAMLIVRPPKPAGLTGKLSLLAENAFVRLFASETPVKDEKALDKKHVFDVSTVPASGLKFFVEGATPSAAARDTGFRLGVDGVESDGDRVQLTCVHTEIVSDVEEKNLKLAARVPEKPERKTKSKFMPAPLLVGRNYDVQLRPHVELAKPETFAWSSKAPQVTLTDTAKEVLKLHAKSLSGAENDITLDLLVASDLGKFKRSHKLTIVNVEIDPVTTGDSVKHSDDINRIKNPSGLVILSGAAAADAKQVPKIEITKIEPALSFTDDDPRLAWWIVGGEAAEVGKFKYEGKADFRNDENAKRGTKIQVFGTQKGDVLVQPYSGGFGFGMFRANVVELRKVKYRVNRIIRPAQAAVPPTPGPPATPALPALPERKPTATHDDAKKQIKVVNIYLRAAGIELIPDDSAEVASSAGNPKVGLATLDARVTSVTKVSDGHFDVNVNDQALTFRAARSDAVSAVRINTRNEVVSFAYLHSRSTSTALATAVLCPWNHAPLARADPPRVYSAASYTLADQGIPSNSLIPKTGIPGDTPVGEVKMLVLFADVAWLAADPGTRHTDLLWGVDVPTTSIDSSSSATGGDATILAYGNTLAHEMGHVLGLGHRGVPTEPIPPSGVGDRLARPRNENLMHPSNPPPQAENLDIIQVKAIRFSEIMFRNP